MNNIPDLFGSPVLQRIGLTLLHSLWQIALIAIAVTLILRIGRALKLLRSANSRYVVQCLGLALMLFAPIATFFLSGTSATSPERPRQRQLANRAADLPGREWAPGFRVDGVVEINHSTPISLERIQPGFPLPQKVAEFAATSVHANFWLIGLAWLWLLGAFVMLGHSMVQWSNARQLCLADTSQPPIEILGPFEKLLQRMRLSTLIQLKQSKLVDVPTLIGWLKPIILLPPAMISGLSARELELILLHELIHIKRHDYLVNVMQTGIESLLFYHPCVWWLSKQIRTEREFAADEQVVYQSNDQITYARALLQLEQCRTGSRTKTGPALAATDGSLLIRVQKIVDHRAARPIQARLASEWFVARPVPRNHSLALRACIPLVLITLPVLVAGTCLLASSLFSDLENKHESNSMPRYSDNFTRMQRPDVSFGYGDADINDMHPWQAPFGIASREIDYDDGWELWCAAADGKADVVKKLIEKDSRLKDLAFRYHCPLDLAIYGGHTQCVKILLDADTELAEKWGWYGWKRMLGIAKEMGHDEIHDLTLQRIENKFNYHPDIQLMVQALCDQDIDAMKHLLDEDVERVNIADEDGNTALHWAAFSRQIPMIDLLVERGADPSRRNGAHAMPHQVKMWTSHKKELIRGLDDWSHVKAACDRLLELGAEVDFHTAVGRGDLEQVRKMLANDKSLVHHMPGHLGSPLKAAVGNPEMLQLLLDHDADPNMTEHTAPFGCALYTAVSQNKYASAKLLLENGAEPMQYSDSSGDTLFAANLWILDETDRKRMIKLLNEHSGKEHIVIPQRNDKPEHEVAAAAVREVLARDTVTDWQVGHLLDVILLYRDAELLQAYIDRIGDEAKSRIATEDARGYQGRLLELLTENGAKVLPVDISTKWMGATILHWNQDDVSLVAEFVEAGGDIDAINQELQTALSNAVSRSNIEMVRELLKHGADPELPVRFKTNQPLNLAQEKGNEELIALLEKAVRRTGFSRKTDAIPPEGGTTNKGARSSKGEPKTNERPWRDGPPKEYNYSNVDLTHPVNQWQKAIETRDVGEVARLLNLHPEYANMKIMDRYRDGRLNTKGHHQESLDHVARTGHLEIAKLLVAAGANEERIQGAFMIAEPNAAEFLLEHCDDPKPDIGLMAYLGKWEAMEFWFERGYQPESEMLHDACCGRPSMRHFAARVDSDSNLWPLQYRETVRVLIEAGSDVNARTLGGNEKWGGAKPWRKNRETPLHIAAASHDIVLIQQLLDAGADKTLTNDLGDTPSCWAIRYNAPADVIKLLDFEGNPRRNPELWGAAHAGDLNKVKQLIEAGADPNAYDENGSGTLLNFNPEVTKYLLSKGANPDLQQNENILPVLVGIAGFHTECLKALLAGGANPNISGHHNGETALHHAVCGDNFEQVKALLDAGADPNKRTLTGKMTYMLWRDARCRNETPLHRAAAYGTPEVIQLLLDNGADPTRKDANKDTPLSWASWHHRDKSIIDILAYEGSGVGPDYPPADWNPGGASVSGKALAAGGTTKDSESTASASRLTNADSSAQPRNDELVAASLGGDLDQVRKLIEGGADPNSVDANGMGPLLNFHPEVTAYLLSKGADPDIQRNENILPVIAGVASNLDCVQLMLEAGADVNRACDHNGETLLHYAASGRNIELIKLVLDAGANPNARTIPGMRTFAMWRDVRTRGETPLHRNAAWGTAESIQALLDAGADPNIRDANGDSPLSWASWYMRERAIIDLLQNAMNDARSTGLSESGRNAVSVPPEGGTTNSAVSGTALAAGDIVDLAKKGNFEKLHELWKSGTRFDLGKVFERAITDFRSVKRNKGHQQTLQLCIDNGLDPLARVDWLKQPAICTAAMYGNVELIEHVSNGIGLPDNPFVRAAVGDVKYLETFAESKGDNGKKAISELCDENGFNLLHYAAGSGLGRNNIDYRSKLEATCKFLIECGVATNLAVENEISLTPALMCAWFGGNPVIMQNLLDARQIKINDLQQAVEFAFEPHQRSGDPFEEVANVILQNGFDLNSIYPDQKRTLLHGSSNRGSIEAVTWLLKNGAEPNKLDHQGRTALHAAAIRNRHTGVVELLVDHGADTSAVDNEGNTASDLAKSKGRDKVVSFLEFTVSGKALAAGDIEDSTEPAASASRLTSEVSTSISKTVTNMNLLSPDHPFIAAVREANLPRIKELVAEDNSLLNAQVRGDISLTGKVWKAGAHVDVSDDAPEHAGALHFAAFHGHDVLAQLLIHLGADLEADSYFGEKRATPVTLAAWEGNKETLEVILKAISGSALAAGESRAAQLRPALFTCLVHQSNEKADLLIEHGAEHDIFTAAMAGEGKTLTKLIAADPDSVNQKHPEYNRTPLEQALKVGQTEMAELLAENGANVTTPSAAAMGRVEEVKAVLEKDGEAATRQFGSYPLLIWAIHGKQVKVVEFLLQHGADPNGGDRWGYSPLSHVANIKGDAGAAIVDLLLAAGADPKKESRDKTPIQWALENKNKHVHHCLVRYIENDVEVSELEMEFWQAVEDDDLKTVTACLEKDSALASKRFPTHNELFFLADGFPLFVATRNGHWEIAQLLLDHGADPDAKRDLEESRILGIGNNHRELGMPLHFAAAVHQNYAFANKLLDGGATASGHPYCDQSTIERMFYQACQAGVPEAVVRRGFAGFLPDQAELESRSVTELVGDDAAESVKLFARMVDLDSQPPFSGLVREGFDDLLIEIVAHCHDKDGTPHDHPQGNVASNITGAARWSGYPKLLRRLTELPSYQYSYGYTIETIGVAIGSHNRDGDYSAYREIIVMQLEALKANGDLERAQQDANFQPFYKIGKSFTWHSNYGYRAEIAKPECYIDLAELFVSWGFEGIEFRIPESSHSPLSIAVERGHHPGKATYIRWLLERGADLRKLDPDEVNPIAIAKEKGHQEILELLEEFDR